VLSNAGVVEVHPLTELTVDHYRRHFDTNVLGSMPTVQKALPHLRDGASVILTGSILAAKAADGYSLYSATKAALRSFARAQASRHPRSAGARPGRHPHHGQPGGAARGRRRSAAVEVCRTDPARPPR
jgi:NAD(P)-dependent dehydrogenase (short-subunit alcohol dehydrogenase family)